MRQKLRSHLTFANIVSLLALSVALGGTTYAATGGNFILGQANTASSTTALSSGTTGPAFKVTSTNTAAGATALGLNVASSHAPLTVNSGAKVTNLNADKLDGKHSTAFLGSTAKAADSDKLDGIDSSQLEGARAFAVSGGFSFCPGDPVVFCTIPRNKGVAYVVKVGHGRYCVGVNNISAADPTSVALVSILGQQDSDFTAAWANAEFNSACVSTEFEVVTAYVRTLNPGAAFTMVIP